MPTPTLAELLNDRTSIVERTEKTLAQIEQFDGDLNAFIRVTRDESLTRARTLQFAGSERGPLHGVLLAIKDLLDIAGEITSAASDVFAENVAEKDAEVVGRLRNAGAVFVGKTNLHEFAYGGSGVISNRGATRNPWDTSRITGGSSSGSAAAVAAGMCAAAIGTDTAGSIRLPASFCGIVGFKPTFGIVPTEGVVPLGVSFDHVGPMTRCVADARTLFEVMSGRTPSSAHVAAKLRVGIPERYFYRDVDGEIGKLMASVLRTLTSAGHTLVDIDLPVEEDRTLVSYEAYRYHAEWVHKSPELYQSETLRRILTGAKISEGEATEAQAKLRHERGRSTEIFTGIDVLLTPTVPVLPATIDELLASPDALRHRELIMLRNTRPFNVLGVPAISLPWDLSSEGLPIGIQLVAAPEKDFELLAMAEEFERLAPWQGRTPPRFI